MNKKSTPLGDIVRSIKVNTGLVIGLAVILVIAAYVYIPTIQQELRAKPSEAFDAEVWDGGDLGTGIPIPWDEDLFKPWTPEGEEILLVPQTSKNPKIHNNKVVYEFYSEPYGQSDIYLKNLDTEGTIPISVNPNNQSRPDIYNNLIVWTDDRNSNLDIYMYNLATQTETNITSNVSTNSSYSAIYGDYIVFTNTISVEADEIKTYNIHTGVTKVIDPVSASVHKIGLKIFENHIIWTETNSVGAPEVTKSYIYNILTEEKNLLAEQSCATDLSNKWIAWTNLSQYPYIDVYIQDKGTQEEHNITNNTIGRSGGAAISEDIIVWQNILEIIDPWNDDSDIYIHRMQDPIGANHQITTNEKNQVKPDIFENIIIWEDYRYDDPATLGFSETNIYMFEITN